MLKKGLTYRSVFVLFLAIFISLSIVRWSVGFAQVPAPQTPVPTQPPVVIPSESNVLPIYKEPRRDPFFDEKLIKKPNPTGPRVDLVPEKLPWPTYEERDGEWRRRRSEAERDGRPEPNKSERYLIDELQIVGLFRRSDGQGALLKPKAGVDARTFFATVGQKFYNGKITGIQRTRGEVEFEEITKFNIGNKTTSEKRVLRYTHGK